MSKLIKKSAALQVARKRLPIKGAKALAESLEYAGVDPAEAYRIGAAEAQAEIVARLAELRGEG